MDLPLRQSLLLGAFLAHRDDWVGRDEVLALFWPDEAESTARHNLSQLVYHCRRQPWFDGLEAERTRLRWRVASDLQLFRAAIGAGAWHDALDQYGGTLLESLPAGGAPEFEAWLETERESLQVAWREAVVQVAGTLEAEGRPSEAIARVVAVLDRDPLAEDAVQIYLRCARAVAHGEGGAGPRAAALRAYEAFRTTLREELDLAPLEATVALAEALRADVGPAPVSPAPPPAAPAEPPPAVLRGFPAPVTPFLGREVELAQLHALLAEGGERLVTLLGPGGVGKTRLAIEAGRRAAWAFDDGAVFVPLADLDDPAYVARTIGAALGLEPATDQDDEAALVDALAPRSLLLVLDNLEHLLEGAGLLAELLAASPGSSLLITSQEPLDFQGEVRFEVAGMAYPPTAVGGASIERFDAVALFLRSARRAHPQFVATGADHAGIVRLCQLLEGLPLGLELAAARMRLLRPAEVADALEANLDALAVAHRDLPARHRSLRAMLDHTWSLLSDEERAALASVSVFRGGFTREAAAAAAGAGLRTLLALVNKSLLRRTAGGRFVALEVVRRYGAERLAAEPSRFEAVATAHAAHFVAFGLEAQPELVGAERATWLDRVAAEHENLRTALAHLIATGGVEPGMDLAHALFQFWWLRGHYREARTTIDALLRLEGPRSAALEARALGDAGAFARLCEEFEAARALYEGSLAIKRGLDDPTSLAATLGNLGNLLRLLGDLDGAQRHLEEVLGLYRAAGDGGRVANTLNNLGAVAEVRGDVPAAELWYREALEVANAVGDAFVGALALGNLGTMARERGDLAEARAHHVEAGAVFERLGYRVGLAVTAQQLADLDLRAGDLIAARSGYALAMARFADLGDQRGVAEVAGSLVDLAVAVEDWAEALRWLGATHAQHERLGIARSAAVMASLDAQEVRARTAVGAERAAALRAEGADWTMEEALAQARTV